MSTCCLTNQMWSCNSLLCVCVRLCVCIHAGWKKAWRSPWHQHTDGVVILYDCVPRAWTHFCDVCITFLCGSLMFNSHLLHNWVSQWILSDGSCGPGGSAVSRKPSPPWWHDRAWQPRPCSWRLPDVALHCPFRDSSILYLNLLGLIHILGKEWVEIEQRWGCEAGIGRDRMQDASLCGDYYLSWLLIVRECRLKELFFYSCIIYSPRAAHIFPHTWLLIGCDLWSLLMVDLPSGVLHTSCLTLTSCCIISNILLCHQKDIFAQKTAFLWIVSICSTRPSDLEIFMHYG